MNHKSIKWIIPFVMLAMICLFSSCGIDSDKMTSESQLQNDLFHSTVFSEYGNNLQMEITSLTITKRQTTPEDKIDTIWVSVEAASDKVNCQMYYIMTYGLYNDGWQLDSIETDNVGEWAAVPLGGMEDEEVRYYIPDNAEIISNTVDFEERCQRVVYTYTESHKYCDIVFHKQISFTFGNNYYSNLGRWTPIGIDDVGSYEVWDVDGIWQYTFSNEDGYVNVYFELSGFDPQGVIYDSDPDNNTFEVNGSYRYYNVNRYMIGTTDLKDGGPFEVQSIFSHYNSYDIDDFRYYEISTSQRIYGNLHTIRVEYDCVTAFPSGVELTKAAMASTTEHSESKQFASIESLRETVSSGWGHIVGLRNDGTVEAAGNNADGQCNVSGWTDIVAISANSRYTLGLKSDGTIVAAGRDTYSYDLSIYSDIIAISAGEQQAALLKADGTVYAVGNNQYGQCDVDDWTNIIAVASGGTHTVGLKSDGTVVAVGDNRDGQCDVGDWTNIIAIAAGCTHTVALKSDGTVVAVGNNDHGESNVNAWTDIVAVAAGNDHTVGLKSDGTVIAVGNNNDNACNVNGWADIVAISASNCFLSGSHTVGLKADGTVVAVGGNEYGECDTVKYWTDIATNGR